MWGKSFHKLCGFQSIHTSVMWDKRRGKKTPWEWRLWGGVTQKGGRQGIWWNVQENTRQQPNTTDCNCCTLSSFCMVRNSCNAHKHAQAHICTDIHTQMDNPRNPDSNCFLCAFSVERESKEWYREEFQISKAIFHFPPSEGVWALTVFWKHWTSETHSSTNTACVHHTLLIQCFD